MASSSPTRSRASSGSRSSAGRAIPTTALPGRWPSPAPARARPDSVHHDPQLVDMPPVLVSANGAILYVDLVEGSFRVLRPYPGNLASTCDRLLVVRGANDQSRLEIYDSRGLVCMRPL